MPGLPEVKTVHRGSLRITAKHKVSAIDVYYGKAITNDVEDFRQALVRQAIENVGRRGKYLLFRFTNDSTMVSHLRMEGGYYNQPIGEPIGKHTRAVFEFTCGTELCYQDTRKFGRMTLVKTGDEMSAGRLKTIGPEPTEDAFTLPYLIAELKKSRGKIEPFLLNQRHVTGLGSIYVDEVLWMAGVNPEQSANALTASQITELRKNIIKELAAAIRYKETIVHSFMNAFGDAGAFQDRLKAYGRTGDKYPRRDTKMAKVKIAKRRTTSYSRCRVLEE